MKGENKFKPLQDKEYILTDMCFWEPLTDEEKENYNPYDKTRTPHGVNLIDAETGTVVNLLSGSVVKIIKAKY